MTTFAERMKEYLWMEKEKEIWEYLAAAAAQMEADPNPMSTGEWEQQNPVISHVIGRIENEILAPISEKMAALELMEVKDAGKKGTKGKEGSGKAGGKAGGKAKGPGKQGLRRPIRFGKKAGPVDGGGDSE